jgi:D-3-phosphoglycerate dehydrogenase
LDVFEKEPLSINSELRRFENVILSSHNAFNTVENVEKVNQNTLKNITKVLK